MFPESLDINESTKGWRDGPQRIRRAIRRTASSQRRKTTLHKVSRFRAVLVFSRVSGMEVSHRPTSSYLAHEDAVNYICAASVCGEARITELQAEPHGSVEVKHSRKENCFA